MGGAASAQLSSDEDTQSTRRRADTLDPSCAQGVPGLELGNVEGTALRLPCLLLRLVDPRVTSQLGCERRRVLSVAMAVLRSRRRNPGVEPGKGTLSALPGAGGSSPGCREAGRLPASPAGGRARPLRLPSTSADRSSGLVAAHVSAPRVSEKAVWPGGSLEVPMTAAYVPLITTYLLWRQEPIRSLSILTLDGSGRGVFS